MRFNPCGKAVDLGSRPFSAEYLPFRDSDIKVRIRWFPCAPGAEFLGLESCISNPFWERDQFEFTDGGDVLESVIPTGKPRFIPGTGKGHVCGSEEDFRDGCLFLPDDPPEQLGRSGLPACCMPPVVGRGGVVDGGKVVTTFTPGPSCVESTPLPFDTPITSPGGFGNGWWRTSELLPAGARIRITFSSTFAAFHVTPDLLLPSGVCGGAITNPGSIGFEKYIDALEEGRIVWNVPDGDFDGNPYTFVVERIS